jgi:FeS assembly SUF system regulator
LGLFKIGKLSDYATLLLAKLSDSSDVQSASQLAQLTRIPKPTVAKIMKTLAKAKLVCATRGIEGGYLLAQPAAGITVADVLAVFEGPLGLTDCTTHTGCTHTSYCGTRTHWKTINQAVLTALQAVTIADLAINTRHPYADLAPKPVSSGLPI